MDKDKSVSLDDISEKQEKEAVWMLGYRFENPEAAYIRKETIQEQLEKLTDKQRVIFLLYHREGFNQYEIADMLGLSQPSLSFIPPLLRLYPRCKRKTRSLKAESPPEAKV